MRQEQKVSRGGVELTLRSVLDHEHGVRVEGLGHVDAVTLVPVTLSGVRERGPSSPHQQVTPAR
jgi:hypothetical protein